MGTDEVENGPSPTPGLYTPEELERLGRERPPAFKSIWHELGFCFSLLGSMFVSEYMISGFNVLLPPLAEALDIPEKAETWPASVFSLVTGAFLLPFGRLADIYGGYIVFISGLAWFVIWSLIGGFSQNYIMLIFCRALQGFGPAAFLPSGIGLLGSIYRPGPRKNFVFSLYGAFAPVGFFAGIFFAGLTAQFLTWNWFFYIGTIFLAIVSVVSYWAIPCDVGEDYKEEVKMDWLGTIVIVPALMLIVYGLTDGSHAPNGWATPYVLVTFILGWILIGVFVYIEGWVAEQPLLPFDLFQVKGMGPLTIALFFDYGVFGIFLFYASFYMENILGASPLLTAAWFAPMCVGGLILATIGGLILHLLPGTILLLVSGTCWVIAPLLFAVMPTSPNYWAFIFPAMICATAGIDIIYNVTTIFITTSLPKRRQGLAGALVNTLLFLGISFFLGFADLAAAQTKHLGARKSYKVNFWFAVGLSSASLVILALGVRLSKAESGLTVDEKAELERELTRRDTNQEHPA
ncbi:MFS general substrate transporter [Aaosphaeria arxii CBS 175.79]|uniref:MFS general substrate transporter n=1 Tax=Aaosphaeria arxii CBS 175.79 TaxID=1450172 RepID=A0A6A5XQK5_9PLEO|nr:MFS general substrate transporter [Aaosphaeria arxii CBS 175.79]KAF2015117.1 MFS general substrate transporter [Aaosphaeria arxii CBS 175.79]